MTTLRLIDTHAHLDEFPDLNPVVERAKNAGVIAVIAVGTSHASNEKTLHLSQSHRGYIFPAQGIHPWEVGDGAEEEITAIEAKIKDCVAIGEIGLDYWIKKEKEIQRRTFKQLLELAVRWDKPVSIHTRGAWEDAYLLVAESKIKKAVFHWYSGPQAILHKILDSGYLVSATPAVAYSKALREAVKFTPIDSLLLETDSPVKYMGITAEPATVVKTLKYVAELKGILEEVVAEKTTENAIALFNLQL